MAGWADVASEPTEAERPARGAWAYCRPRCDYGVLARVTRIGSYASRASVCLPQKRAVMVRETHFNDLPAISGAAIVATKVIEASTIR